jgi:hypothetical protein
MPEDFVLHSLPHPMLTRLGLLGVDRDHEDCRPHQHHDFAALRAPSAESVERARSSSWKYPISHSYERGGHRIRYRWRKWQTASPVIP